MTLIPQAPPAPISQNGLSTPEARERLARFGPNELIPAHRQTILVQILARFISPLVAILLIASVISAFTGDWVNALIIGTIILFSVALEFAQTYRSQRAVEALRSQVAPTATVLRDGRWQELPRQEVVRGGPDPALGGGFGSGRRRAARGQGPARAAGRPHRRVAARREGGGY